jgi:hypothetical protein
LIGESNTGSWRTQTPFSTTASTAQPTEQWPQTVRLTTTFFSPAPAHGSAAPGLLDERQLRSGEAGADTEAGSAQEGAAVHRRDRARHAAFEAGNE